MGISFPNKEAAMEYAERNGYNYEVVEPEREKRNVRRIAPFRRSMVHHWRHDMPVYDESK